LVAARDIENRIPITVALILGTMMMALDATIANVALPHMQGSVSASQDEITWVLTSYILASAIMTPLSGWLSEKIGRKRLLILSVSSFTAASMLCGIATSLPELVAFRTLQGLAGASLMPIAQTTLLDLYPRRMLPRVMSVWSATVVLAPVMGPTVGGWITEHLTWRWAFFINLPIGAAALFVISTFMARDEGGRQRPFDFLGFAALVLFMIVIQVMLDRGAGQDWFDSREILTEAILGVIGLYVFTIHTATADHPFFHRDVAKDTNFVGGCCFAFIFNGIFFSTSALLPSFTQNLLGYSAMQAGWATMPRGLGALLSFILIPWIIGPLGQRRMLLCGIVLGVASSWTMSRFDLSMTPRQVMDAAFIQGVGTGLTMTPLMTLTFGTLNPVHRAEGAVLFTMLRNLGASIGISAAQTLLIRDSALAHARMAERLSASDPILRTALPIWMDPGTRTGLEALNGEVTRQASMVSYVNVFSWMTLGVLALVPLVLLLRPVREPMEHEIIVE
jgi:DHA2 family multidrug resistance protein